MANLKVGGKGGQGGRLGHSNMEHSTYTEEVKRAARKKRRTDAKNAVRAGFEDAAQPKGATAAPRHGGRRGRDSVFG
jgi:hypothetical protein